MLLPCPGSHPCLHAPTRRHPRGRVPACHPARRRRGPGRLL